MKVLRVVTVGLAALALAFLAAPAGRADGVVTARPDRLTLAGSSGDALARTLILQATAEITSVQVVVSDLHKGETAVALPAGAVTVRLPADRIEANGVLTVPLTVDLGRAPSGEFSGDLLVLYHGGSLTIPLTVRVKAGWLWPAVAIVVGVALSAAISVYRSRGRPRDQVIVRMGQLRAQMDSDKLLPAAFRGRIEAGLLDVETCLQGQKWEEANTAVGDAEALLLKWRRGRADWLAQLAYLEELKRQLAEAARPNPTAGFVLALGRSLEDLERGLPDEEGPDPLRKKLQALADRLNRFLRLRGHWEVLQALAGKLDDADRDVWLPRLRAWQRRIDDLAPDNEADCAALQGEIEAAIAAVQELLAQRAPVGAKGSAGAAVAALVQVAPAPSAGPLDLAALAPGARWRLFLFTLATSIIAVAFLALAGFNELYTANATFGAAGLGDYLALLAWGFGAEASRAAILEMVRGWGQ